MAALSPHRPSITSHSSDQSQTSNMTNYRPTLMKRQSSASSNNSNKHNTALSPGSLGEQPPLRHHVKPAKRGHKVRLPQNHGSNRNLMKLAQQVQNQYAAEEKERRRTSNKPRGSEGEASNGDRETQIRLPGSLDESRMTMRRNLTTTHFPRNTSHTKLKKNLSHGQLTRLGLNASGTKGPPSPGLKGKSKRPRSADLSTTEQDLHEQEIALAQRAQQKQQPKPEEKKKVGFAVGSSEEEDGDLPQMEGSGLPAEDEWTDQSASASPYSTRVNTANNSRRASVVVTAPTWEREKQEAERSSSEDSGEKTETADVKDDAGTLTATLDGAAETDDFTAKPSTSTNSYQSELPLAPNNTPRSLNPPTTTTPSQQHQLPQPPQSTSSRQSQISFLQNSKSQHPNPATRRLLSRNSATAAPALVSNVSALDDSRSSRRVDGEGSDDASMTSSRSHLANGSDAGPGPSATSADLTASANLAAQDQHSSGELVSRFVPTGSHPSTLGSAPNTGTVNTPKAGSLHTPETDEGGQDATTPPTEDKQTQKGFTIGPATPPTPSTIGEPSASTSFATTPSTSFHAPPARSRNEIHLLHEKTLAQLETHRSQHPQPIIPPHVFDRRNESLKSYLNLASLGGNGQGGLSARTGLPVGGLGGSGLAGAGIFEGRFKAVNQELKVVQRFRDPVGESVGRLKGIRGVDVAKLRNQRKPGGVKDGKGNKLLTSRSAVSLPKGTAQPQGGSQLSSSASPPKASTAANGSVAGMGTSKSSAQLQREGSSKSKVSFQISGEDDGRGKAPSRVSSALGGADEIARRLWESVA